MNTATMNRAAPQIRILTSEEMTGIVGGTFTPNTHSKGTYHAVGISTSYNFFSKDEFRFMGSSISYDQANDIVAIARRVSSAINDGYQGANKIGYSDKMFINAFNSQLKLKYGIVWNGIPGTDF